MKANSRDRVLSNGKLYCGEQAATEGAQDDCIGELEDTLFLAEADKDNMFTLTQKFVLRLKLVRDPCNLWERMRKLPRCTP